MSFFIFTTTFVWNISHSIIRTERDMIKNVCLILMYCNSCRILMILEFSWEIPKKYSNIKFHENPFSGSQVVACRWTGIWTDIMKLAVAFRNFAYTPRVVLLHVMKPCRGSRSIDQPVLKLGTKMEVSGQSHALTTLLPVPTEQKSM